MDYIIGRRKPTYLTDMENEEVYFIEYDGEILDTKAFSRDTNSDKINAWMKTVVDEHKKINTDKEGVWVVYDYDTNAYPIVVYKEEIEAHRYREQLGYGHVRFLEFGTEWGA